MKPRRLLFVVTKMDQGGAMSLPLLLAEELRRRGHITEVWYLYRYSDCYDNESGVRVLLPIRISNLGGYFHVFIRLLRAMRKFRPDAVYGVLPLGNIFGLTVAAMIGCPSRVASQHNPARSHHPVMQHLDKLLGAVGIYTTNIAVSHAVRESYKKYPRAYVRRLQVIRNGVLHRAPVCTKVEARTKFGLPQKAWILGNVGRLSFQKHQKFLLDVVAQTPDVHLVIAGEGELRAEYEEQIQKQSLSDRVHLLGSVPDAQMPDFYVAVDVFVLPSRFEGLPISLIEAMNAALPIIASRIPPLVEVLHNEDGREAGIILETDSIDPWTKTLRKLMTDPTSTAHWANASLERAKAFSLDHMVDQYEALLLQDKK